MASKRQKASEQSDADIRSDDDVVKKQQPEKPVRLVVASGKSITSKRGIIGPGKDIAACDLSGGEAALGAFVRSGHVVKG